MAETRRCDVLELARSVSDLTFERRMESLGGFFTALVEVAEVRRRNRRAGCRIVRCILVVGYV
jgi:hypothetical protein